MTALDFLAEWHAGQCDGDWEHTFGISIATVDNPGWTIDVPLQETDLAGRTMADVKVESDGGSWFHVWSDGSYFHGRCGCRELATVLEQFQRFCTQRADEGNGP